MEEKKERIVGLFQLIFGMDCKTPINQRTEYGHSTFFSQYKFAKFLLSVYGQFMDNGKISDKQAECIINTVRKNYQDLISCFYDNLSAPSMILRMVFTGVELDKKQKIYYDKNGNRVNGNTPDKLLYEEAKEMLT